MGKLLQALTGSLSSNLGDTVKSIASIWKVDPAVVLQNETEVQRMANALALKTIDSATVEIQSAADIIKAEAQSQSWLPRNVRPLLLLLWGLTITLSAIGIRAAIYKWCDLGVCPPLDPWIYKLVAIGYTGYVTARTYEKAKGADN